MKHLKSYKIFESNSNILEYMYILTDNEPEISFESSYGILIFDLNRKTECDKDDIEAVRSALEDIGWFILNIFNHIFFFFSISKITIVILNTNTSNNCYLFQFMIISNIFTYL